MFQLQVGAARVAHFLDLILASSGTFCGTLMYLNLTFMN